MTGGRPWGTVRRTAGASHDETICDDLPHTSSMVRHEEEERMSARVHRFSRTRFHLGLALSIVVLTCVAGCGDGGVDETTSTELVGRTADGASSVAFARIDNRVIGYVCNDDDTGEWFQVPAGQHPKEVTSDSGAARILLDSPGTYSEGVFVAKDGTEHRFHAFPAADDQGLFLLFGDEPVAVDPTKPEDISIEQLINNALVHQIQASLGTADTVPFRAGWIVDAEGRTQGNVTIRQTSTTTALGNLLPFVQNELKISTQLSVRKLVGTLSPKLTLDEVAKLTGATQFTPFVFCNSVDFDSGTCTKLKAINAALIKISNAVSGVNDTLDAAIDAELDECANRLIDFCA
jgi:hypothetical protein